MQTCTWSSRLNFMFMAKREKSCRGGFRLNRAATLDCAPTRRGSASLARGNSLLKVARLRTDPQHTPPPLPLLRSRPGGVRGASVVRGPKPDKLSKSCRLSAVSFQPLDFNPARPSWQTRRGRASSPVKTDVHAAQIGARELARRLHFRERRLRLGARAPRVDGHDLVGPVNVRVVDFARLADAARGEDLL